MFSGIVIPVMLAWQAGMWSWVFWNVYANGGTFTVGEDGVLALLELICAIILALTGLAIALFRVLKYKHEGDTADKRERAVRKRTDTSDS